MSSRLTKKSLVSVSGRLVKTPCWMPPKLAFSTRMPPTSTVISGAVSVSRLRLVDQQGLGRQSLLAFEVVAEAVRDRFEHGERLDVGLLLRGVRAAGREGDRHVVTGLLRRLLDAGATGQDDQVGERDLLAAGWPPC